MFEAPENCGYHMLCDTLVSQNSESAFVHGAHGGVSMVRCLLVIFLCWGHPVCSVNPNWSQY